MRFPLIQGIQTRIVKKFHKRHLTKNLLGHPVLLKETVQKRVPPVFLSFQRKEELVTRQIGVFQVLELSGSNFPPLLTYANHIMIIINSCIRSTKNKVLMKMSFKIQKN